MILWIYLLPASLRGRVILGKGNEVTIGDRIRRIRKKRRLTQVELAMMSGLSLSAIQGYEQGRYEPKRKSLESIAEVFKIPVYELCDTPAQHSTNLASLGTDCISRQAAIDALDKCHCGGKDENGRPWIYKENAVEAIEMVEPLPSAEPKRGKWILDRSGAYCCSECMEPCATYVMMQPRDKFCKMCGSRNEVTE